MRHCPRHVLLYLFFFFFNDPATTEIYTLSLHDALPIYAEIGQDAPVRAVHLRQHGVFGMREHEQARQMVGIVEHRSEEHTSELQSQSNLVCRLLLEKKKKRVATMRMSDVMVRSINARWV